MLLKNRVFLTITFAAATASLGCAHRHPDTNALVPIPAPQRSVATNDTYLDSREFASPAHDRLLEAAQGRGKPSGAEVTAWIAEYEKSAQFKKLAAAYSDRLYRHYGTAPDDGARFHRKYPRLVKGIVNYVGDSGESMADEGPSWQRINIRLRDGEKMSDEEKKFYDEILYSVNALPRFAGLVFRGQKIEKKRFAAMAAGQPWARPAFTSTSVDPDVARAFGGVAWEGDHIAVVILSQKNGRPVSPLTFDTGKRGEPGRLDEREVLLPPGAKLLIHHTALDEKAALAYVFAEER